ncbi:MAG: LamG domain-containing protein, partial [Candidatus Sumerlaeota bacterium]
YKHTHIGLKREARRTKMNLMRWIAILAILIGTLACHRENITTPEASFDLPKDPQERSLDELRKYRIALLDRERIANSADDDAEAQAARAEIEKIDKYIHAAEREIIAQPDTPGHIKLPGGLHDELVLLYTFDEGRSSFVQDHSEMQNHGQITGGHWTSRGRQGGAYWLDGLKDYIEAPPSESLARAEAMTLSICLYPESNPAIDDSSHSAYFFSHSSQANSGLWLYLSPTRGMGAGIRNPDKPQKYHRLPSDPTRFPVPHKEWTHIVLVLDGNTMRTYINGRLDKASEMSALPDLSNLSMYIGRWGNGKWAYGYCGRVDDVAIWNRALSETEILGLWTWLFTISQDGSQVGR